MKKKIFIACDTANINKVKRIIKNTRSKKIDIIYKFGLEFFYSKYGRSFISNAKKLPFFLDLKLNDIPNTSVSALKSIKDLKNIKYLTVHISGGLEMISKVKKIAKKVNKKIKILGVTILTSLNDKSVKQVGYSNNIKHIVIKQTKLAKKAKLDGIVCSAHEIKYVKKFVGKMEIITPGIRMVKDNFDDQKRVVTPVDAFDRGASGVVIGRSITSGNIKNNFKKLLNQLS